MAIENLSPRTIVTAPGPQVPGVKEAMASTATLDKSDWQWVEVPEEDLFGEKHTGVSINFEQFGPGRHFVSAEKAGEINRLLQNRVRSDMRILQPNQDKKMLEIMERNGKAAPRGF